MSSALDANVAMCASVQGQHRKSSRPPLDLERISRCPCRYIQRDGCASYLPPATVITWCQWRLKILLLQLCRSHSGDVHPNQSTSGTSTKLMTCGLSQVFQKYLLPASSNLPNCLQNHYRLLEMSRKVIQAYRIDRDSVSGPRDSRIKRFGWRRCRAVPNY